MRKRTFFVLLYMILCLAFVLSACYSGTPDTRAEETVDMEDTVNQFLSYIENDLTMLYRMPMEIHDVKIQYA